MSTEIKIESIESTENTTKAFYYFPWHSDTTKYPGDLL